MREKKIVRKDEREKRAKWEEARKEEISREGKNIREKTKMRMNRRDQKRSVDKIDNMRRNETKRNTYRNK